MRWRESPWTVTETFAVDFSDELRFHGMVFAAEPERMHAWELQTVQFPSRVL